MFEQGSLGYVLLMSGNSLELGRVLLGKFCSLINMRYYLQAKSKKKFSDLVTYPEVDGAESEK